MAKRREREYTPEEAFAITLTAVTRHWYHSDPLVVGVVNAEGTPYPQPLTSDLHSGTWVFFFVSATSPVFDRALAMFRIWEKRYSSLGVRFIFCFKGEYSFFNERKSIETWLKKFGIDQPSVCDFDGALARAFGADGEPALAILNEGSIVSSSFGEKWLDDAEMTLHCLLREESPGLPFWPVVTEEPNCIARVAQWRLHAGSEALVSGKVQLVGNWVFEEDRIVTSDSKAEMHFTSPGSAVEIVARSLSDTGDPTRIRFDTQGASFADEFAGKDFASDDERNSSVVLSGPRAYSALRKLPPPLRKLTFRFPFAKVSSVALYGLEFGA